MHPTPLDHQIDQHDACWSICARQSPRAMAWYCRAWLPWVSARDARRLSGVGEAAEASQLAQLRASAAQAGLPVPGEAPTPGDAHRFDLDPDPDLDPAWIGRRGGGHGFGRGRRGCGRGRHFLWGNWGGWGGYPYDWGYDWGYAIPPVVQLMPAAPLVEESDVEDDEEESQIVASGTPAPDLLQGLAPGLGGAPDLDCALDLSSAGLLVARICVDGHFYQACIPAHHLVGMASLPPDAVAQIQTAALVGRGGGGRRGGGRGGLGRRSPNTQSWRNRRDDRDRNRDGGDGGGGGDDGGIQPQAQITQVPVPFPALTQPAIIGRGGRGGRRRSSQQRWRNRRDDRDRNRDSGGDDGGGSDGGVQTQVQPQPQILQVPVPFPVPAPAQPPLPVAPTIPVVAPATPAPAGPAGPADPAAGRGPGGNVDAGGPAVKTAGLMLAGALYDQHCALVTNDWWDSIRRAAQAIDAMRALGVEDRARSGAPSADRDEDERDARCRREVARTLRAYRGPIQRAAAQVAASYAGVDDAASAAQLAQHIVDEVESPQAGSLVDAARARAQTDPRVARALSCAQRAVAHATATYHLTATALDAARGDAAAADKIQQIDRAAACGNPSAQRAMDLIARAFRALPDDPSNLQPPGEPTLGEPTHADPASRADLDSEAPVSKSTQSKVGAIALIGAAIEDLRREAKSAVSNAKNVRFRGVPAFLAIKAGEAQVNVTPMASLDAAITQLDLIPRDTFVYAAAFDAFDPTFPTPSGESFGAAIQLDARTVSGIVGSTALDRWADPRYDSSKLHIQDQWLDVQQRALDDARRVRLQHGEGDAAIFVMSPQFGPFVVPFADANSALGYLRGIDARHISYAAAIDVSDPQSPRILTEQFYGPGSVPHHLAHTLPVSIGAELNLGETPIINIFAFIAALGIGAGLLYWTGIKTLLAFIGGSVIGYGLRSQSFGQTRHWGLRDNWDAPSRARA